MRKLFNEESIPLSIGLAVEATSEYWAMGAATERERNIEKKMNFVLSRMIGKIRIGWVFRMNSKRSINHCRLGMKAHSAHKVFDKIRWNVCIANVRELIMILPSNLAS